MQFQLSGGAWRSGGASFLARYLFALFLFAVALAARFMLVDVLPARGFPFLSFFPAVLLTAYMVGLGPGMLVAMLSTVSAWAFFMGPAVGPASMASSDIIALVFFAVILVVDCLVIDRMNTAMRQLRTAGDKLRASEMALIAQQAELREASRQKDVFIAMLAHELRNPLAPIVTAAQLIAVRAGQDQQVARAAGIVLRQGRQLTRLVDDLLDVSRIHSAKLTLQMTAVDLLAVVHSAIETLQPVIDASSNRFVATLPAHPVMLHADGARLAQCISNLLHNAFKFTAGGRIDLRVVRESAGTVAITVTDTGRGISPEMLPRLFEMFSQEGTSGTAGNSGLGIGLALTHYLVQCHGGRLSAHSDGPGLGARFALTLPAGAAPPAVAPAGQATTVQRQAGRILVVDDNADAADTLQELLALHGFEAHTAHTGRAALHALAQGRYDAVLLDIGLPDMSGHEVADTARTRGLLPEDTLVVALTGWSDAESRNKSVQAGIDHHLNKPVQVDALLELLDCRTATA
ncbi:hybrid sensor histidine kinase/response regulator [Massilia forsythiae]|uniref:histidine kinase n=1 Tax=Massilia forsythiae TaxID=2728020 RepID=A0A7Z2ZT91_9BURK|nr:hybrid sensor histidine kinase/response regulator [Massilia forsythiae]QJE00985.1 hybrid sensor histidine kinase/response regulator [Massilia forsythiae]